MWRAPGADRWVHLRDERGEFSGWLELFVTAIPETDLDFMCRPPCAVRGCICGTSKLSFRMVGTFCHHRVRVAWAHIEQNWTSSIDAMCRSLCVDRGCIGGTSKQSCLFRVGWILSSSYQTSMWALRDGWNFLTRPEQFRARRKVSNHPTFLA